ncbi:MAG: tRNA (adenosine(37)-N6)-threonylcarbamoyltransferase complex transferase subunit TsaD [Candidatus Kaiserbacteria bacterium]|nr:tRNA (adenosine(37)-N6)-threonylcarbamoyltransferase complex transferase subunit TsaD [Candidatus Kaiserbacteria bacterium]
MRILGIETSCDESAVCLIDAQGGFADGFKFSILGNALISQTEIHAKYGGVFPNLAKREHAKNLVPVLERALYEAGALNEKPSDISHYSEKLQKILERESELYERLSVFLQKYGLPEIDAIAVTVGPGLEPSLWVGINFARALALVWNMPIVAVNHMEGHCVLSMMSISGFRKSRYRDFVNPDIKGSVGKFEFPVLALLISGGHTELVLSKEFQKYEILGATRDDAVGEAYDKVARLMGLPYPGGPEISRLADKARTSYEMSSHRITLPRPMLHDDNLDFSFAGLKTAVRRIVEANCPLTDEMKLDIALEFEEAVADVLVGKTIKAIDEYSAKTLVVGGGVSANSNIRTRLAEALTEAGLPPPLVTPPALSTDNALMIALVGYFRAQNRDFVNPDTLKADGNLRLI